ncbi:MAG: Bax inhibitor-1/YccA family protein [Marinifilaceae bacterium]
MQLTKSSNPVFSNKVFSSSGVAEESMTVNGTVNKIGLMLLLVVAAASYTWRLFFNDITPEGMGASITPWIIGGSVGGLIFALVTVFKPVWSPYTAPVYAICEGLLLGGLSAMFNSYYPGIVVQAVGLTFATLFAMLFAYKSGWVRVTQKFRTGIIAATGGIALFYLVTFVMSFFGVNLDFMYGSGNLSIGISLVVVVIAALNLVLDFDFIERGAAMGAPKHMEWYGAFGLMVTLIWLYIELLRLLAKFAGRDR